MGDRCWFEITIKEKDRRLFEESFIPEKEYGHEDETSFKTQISFVFQEANYGFYDELEGLSKTSLQFFGNHGMGGTYGPSEFASDGKEFATVETGIEGGYVCNFNTDGTIEESTANEIRKYLEISNRVNKYFDAIELFPTLKKSEELCNT